MDSEGGDKSEICEKAATSSSSRKGITVIFGVTRILGRFSGNAIGARALRGTLLTVLQFGGSNALRLLSNLILTRILFPEAFGLMALTHVFLTGLQMFSQMGINASVIRSERGSDPAFLNTAFTVQATRGVLLWLICVAASYPAAAFYGEPMLAELLQVVGVTAIIQGFASVKIMTANRNLILGRLTALELGSQAFGILIMIIAALVSQSVWALVIGGLCGAMTKTVLSHRVLPGARDKLRFEGSAFWEIFHFGKWLFLGSIAGFMLSHGDRAILGKYIDLDDLAFYNIGVMLGGLSLALGAALIGRVVYPLYCSVLTSNTAETARKITRMRLLLIGLSYSLCAPFILFGRELIELLYDTRYSAAGPMVVGIAFSSLFRQVIASYNPVLLAVGRSREFALLLTFSAMIKTIAMIVAARDFGVPGVIGAVLLSEILVYPVLISLIRGYGVWSWRLDFILTLVSLALLGIALWLDPTVWSDFLSI